jgi:hypothetical protein
MQIAIMGVKQKNIKNKNVQLPARPKNAPYITSIRLKASGV